MSDENTASDFSAKALDEFRVLNLPIRSIKRLAQLLIAEANGTISPSDLAQLEGVREAARYLQRYYQAA